MSTPTDVAQRVYAAFGAGDGPALLALAAPDSTWTLHAPASHPYGGTFRGPEGLGRFLGAIAASVEIVAFGVDELHAVGEHVFAIGHESGRWRTSGRTYAVRWVHRFTVRDGRVTRFEEWFDTASALATR